MSNARSVSADIPAEQGVTQHKNYTKNAATAS